MLLAELQFVQAENKDQVGHDRNVLALLQHRKERMQRQIDVLKHSINSLLDVCKLSLDNIRKMGTRMGDSDETEADTPKAVTTARAAPGPEVLRAVHARTNSGSSVRCVPASGTRHLPPHLAWVQTMW